MELTEQQLQDFWSKVDIRGKNECWLWQGATKKKREYGNVGINGKVYTAHVISWMLVNGRMPLPGLFILHSCDNPRCVNPNHLHEGTHLENMLEMRQRGRAGKKLTPQQVQIIRQSQDTRKEIAKQMNVSSETIGQILRYQTWNAI